MLLSVGFAFLSHQLVATWGPFQDAWEPPDCSRARGCWAGKGNFRTNEERDLHVWLLRNASQPAVCCKHSQIRFSLSWEVRNLFYTLYSSNFECFSPINAVFYSRLFNSFLFCCSTNAVLYFILFNSIGFCCCLATESCLTLWDPMDCSPPGSSIHGLLQATVLEWVAISSSRGSSWPTDGTQVSCVCRQILCLLNYEGTHNMFTSCSKIMQCRNFSK